MAEDKGIADTEKEKPDMVKKKAGGGGGGFLSRIWRRFHGDDLEKRLQYISKEEAAILARMKMRSITWRRVSRNLIAFSIIFEIVAIGYAIMTTRLEDMDWKMRAFRILPMFLLPALSSAIYSAFVSLTKLRERKDQKTLERLRSERQAKIDELKEKTNYYTTQQLIQKYDTDPAAKAAAATVLASKLGTDSGLKVHLGDDPKLNAETGKSSDVEVVQSSGLRNRKQTHTRSATVGSDMLHHAAEEPAQHTGSEDLRASEYNQVVNHHSPERSSMNDGGWIARIAALLVGEDPMQSYALICGNCCMHNGLARKEDYPFITYYCPHCHALNKPKQSEENASSSSTPKADPAIAGGNGDAAGTHSGSTMESTLTKSRSVSPSPEIEGVAESLPSTNPSG